jgi:hypothetical protein
MQEKLRPGDYWLIKISEEVFSLEHRDGTKTEIRLVVNKDDGSVSFEGLPSQFEYGINIFTDQEKREGPLECLSAAIREREGMGQKPDGDQNNGEIHIPSDKDA